LRFLRHLLRIYSYIVFALLSLAALAMAAVIVASPHNRIQVGWLPWQGEPLGVWLAGLGLAGIGLVALAIAGRARFLLTVFALTALCLIVRGFFFSSWRFTGAADAKQACLFVFALFLAFAGSIPMAARRERGYR